MRTMYKLCARGKFCGEFVSTRWSKQTFKTKEEASQYVNEFKVLCANSMPTIAHDDIENTKVKIVAIDIDENGKIVPKMKMVKEPNV